MDGELVDFSNFLRGVAGFADLSEAQMSETVSALTVIYVRKDDMVLEAGTENDFLYIVFSGAVELYLDGRDFHMRLGEGHSFAYPSLMRGGMVRNTVIAIEDSLLYRLPAALFHRLCQACPTFYKSFALAEADRLRAAITPAQGQPQREISQDLLVQPLSSLLRRRSPVTLAVGSTVADAVRMMVDHDVSSLMITDAGRLVGILTDKDLRRRVLGSGVADLVSVHVDTVMTPSPITMTVDNSSFDALMAMTDAHVRHLPLVDAQTRPVGLISVTDVMGGLSHSVLFLRKKVQAAETEAELADSLTRLPPMLVSLIDKGTRPDHIGQLLSSVGEAVHRRAFDMAAARHGITAPPVILVFGSLARRDQTTVSDQDNGFLLPDPAPAAPAGQPSMIDGLQIMADDFAYILNSAGYVFCGGDIMARNPDWRKTAADWRATFRRWMTVPDPKSVLHTTIFFDMRAVGPLDTDQAQAVRDLQADITAAAKDSPIYLAHLAADCARAQVPLGFFRQFVLSRDKAHKDRLDLKHQGTAPIVDLARLYALAAGSVEVDTIARLGDAAASGLLSEADANDLSDAWRFITLQRLKWQADRIRRGQAPDNFIDPKYLSHFDRDHLRDAFQIVSRAQQAAQLKFAGGGML